METRIQPETSKVLMSEVLRGQVPAELEDEAIVQAADQLEGSVVTVVANIQFGSGKGTAVVGHLQSVLFDVEPELEFKVTLEDAFNVVSAAQLVFQGYELHYGDRVIKAPGPFLIKAARMDHLDVRNGLCVLGLGLKRPAR